MKPDPSQPAEAGGGRAAARVKPLDWARAAGRADPVAEAVAAFVRQQRRQRIGAALAGVALLCVCAVWWRAGPGGNRPPAASTVVTLPERRILPDGSVVELKADAALAVEFSADSAGPRRVVLGAGEAHFTVAKDATRPFIVAVGRIAVRAVGTAFSVHHGRQEIDVVVTEGRVSVDRIERPPAEGTPRPATGTRLTPAVAAASSLALVEAGSRAVVAAAASPDAAAQVSALSAADLQARLAWRVARLEFNSTPLSEVIAIFNRHAEPGAGGKPAQLLIAEPSLAALPLSGVLRADNLAVLLKIMETAYGIRAESRANGEILLRPAP